MQDRATDTKDPEAQPREQCPSQAPGDALSPLRKTASMPLLPESAHDLIEVIGLQATVGMVQMYGGSEVALPTGTDSTSHVWYELLEGIGFDAARKLVHSRFGGTRVYVPQCKAALRAERNRQIVRMLRDGERVEHVRRMFGLTTSFVYRIFKRASAS